MAGSNGHNLTLTRRGATQRIEQIKIPFAEIDALFLTHLHSDHAVGIPDLWLTGWARGRKVPLRVWGPDGTKDMMSHLEEAFQFDIRVRQENDKLSPQGVAVVAKDIDQGALRKNPLYGPERFTYLPESNSYRCPAGDPTSLSLGMYSVWQAKPEGTFLPSTASV